MYRMATLAAALLVLAAGCKKDDDSSTADPNDNSFIVDGSRYAIREATMEGTAFYCRDSFNNYVRVTFRGSAPDAGSYDIIGTGTDLTATSVYLTFSRNGYRFYATGNPAASATVSHPDGRLRVSAPSVWVKSDSGDSLKLSCNVIQTK